MTPMLLPLTDTQGSAVSGEAWWVDGYGNVETNVSPEDLAQVGLARGDVVTVSVGSSIHNITWVTSYADVEIGELLLHVDSAGLMAFAVAVRQGRADEDLNLGEGVAVTLAGSKSPTVE